MEKVGVLVVSYGSREAAIIDAFARSLNYKTEIYVVDKQRNPFNVKRAREHVVISDLNIQEITKFVKKHKSKIDFGIVGPEKPIIEGVRDLVEDETHIPLICPTKEFAIEASKVMQRHLLQKVAPEANPKFKVFNPKDYKSLVSVKRDVYKWLDTLDNQAVVKPDRPAAGKGVGVWGDHFNSREQLFEHFLANYQHGTVIIEEKIEGEESSFQALCDGRHLTPLPETRDYKRAFDDDKGPNCYSEDTEILTEDGWKTFDKVKNEEKVAVVDPYTKMINFEKPMKIYWQPYKGKMINFKNRLVDLLVTPNHRMLLQERKGKKRMLIEEAKNYRGERYILQAGKWMGHNFDYFILPEYDYKFDRKLAPKKISFDDWVRFLGVYLSEGFVIKNRVYIVQSKDSPYFNEFVSILKQLPFRFSYRETDSKFRINSVQLAKYLKQFGNSYEKYVPPYVKNAKPETIKEFLKSFCLGDGDVHFQMRRFHTSSKRMVDNLQEMFVKIGIAGTITVDKRSKMLNPLNKKLYPANPVYSIKERKKDKTSIRRKHVKWVDYEGYIGCVTVSTGFVIIRRNNRVAVCGNTGGMGSYKGSGDILPFMTKNDRDKEVELVNKLFNELRRRASKTDLRGVPFYDAFIHTGRGPKLLENNSRPGDPEIQNILPILKDDIVDVCYKILEGNLTHVNVEEKASVLTYKAPPNYGGYASTFPDKINKDEIDTPIKLDEAEKLSRKHGDNIRIYPGSMEMRNSDFYALTSRTVCVVGIADDIQTAREISLEGLKAIKGGALWYRNDIASREHINKSIEHMNKLRQQMP